jgi:hypothetical protein
MAWSLGYRAAERDAIILATLLTPRTAQSTTCRWRSDASFTLQAVNYAQPDPIGFVTCEAADAVVLPYRALFNRS